MTAKRLLLPILFCAGLAGCETRLDLLLFNHLDEEISASVGRQVEIIEAGKSGRLPYPQAGEPERGILVIKVAKCTLSYGTPRDLEEYPWLSKVHGVLPLQREADLELYAIPPGSTAPLPLPEVMPLQKGPFALRPLSRECRSSNETG